MTSSPSSQPLTSSAPCLIYLVRHGTTLLNRANRYRGRIDVALDEGGWRDAWTAAGALQDKELKAVYASPLRRARDTARVIADASGIAVVTDLPGLINLNYGAWDGLTPEEAEEQNPQAYRDYHAYAPGATIPCGENLDVAAERMLLSMRMLAALHPGEAVAAVSHAATVRLLISATTGSPRAQWRRSLPNGGITVFRATTTDCLAVDVPTELVPVE
ncbi:MAG: histidine phosphatase family protein [Kineosporiaceae bacterium]